MLQPYCSSVLLIAASEAGLATLHVAFDSVAARL